MESGLKSLAIAVMRVDSDRFQNGYSDEEGYGSDCKEEF